MTLNLYQVCAIMTKLNEDSMKHGFQVKSAQNGIYMMPVIDGKVVQEEEFEQLEEKVKQEYEAKSVIVQQQIPIRMLIRTQIRIQVHHQIQIQANRLQALILIRLQETLLIRQLEIHKQIQIIILEMILQIKIFQIITLGTLMQITNHPQETQYK